MRHSCMACYTYMICCAVQMDDFLASHPLWPSDEEDDFPADGPPVASGGLNGQLLLHPAEIPHSRALGFWAAGPVEGAPPALPLARSALPAAVAH